VQRTMLATDFSERSDRALRRAVILTRQQGAALEIVHVVDDDRPRRLVDHEVNDARQLLAELARSLKDLDGVACATGVLLDDPFAGIVKAAAKASPDLLVIGPHRRQILRDAFVGTTAERTIRAVRCPVLMVNGPPVGPWRHVLMTTDLSEHSGNALRRCLAAGLPGDAAIGLDLFLRHRNDESIDVGHCGSPWFIAVQNVRVLRYRHCCPLPSPRIVLAR